MEIVSFDKGKMKTFVLICFLVTSATCHTAACSNNINKEGVFKRITIDDDLSQQVPGVIEINLSSINVMVTLKMNPAENTTNVSARYLFKRQKKSNIEEKKLDVVPQQFFKKTFLPEINFTAHLPRLLLFKIPHIPIQSAQNLTNDHLLGKMKLAVWNHF
ncbi:hypothetical protein ACROYT_G036982 [Oculina patagonica]